MVKIELTKAEAELIQEMGEFINHANTKKVLVQVEFKKAWIKRIEELLKKIAFCCDSEVGSSSKVKKLAKTEYFIPPKHIQLLEIANTPHWMREHFRKEGVKDFLKDGKAELIQPFKKALTEIGNFKIKLKEVLCEKHRERNNLLEDEADTGKYETITGCIDTLSWVVEEIGELLKKVNLFISESGGHK